MYSIWKNIDIFYNPYIKLSKSNVYLTVHCNIDLFHFRWSINTHGWWIQLDSTALGCISGVKTNGGFNLSGLARAEEHRTNKTCRNVSNTMIEKHTDYVKMTQDRSIIQPVMGRVGKASKGISELIPEWWVGADPVQHGGYSKKRALLPLMPERSWSGKCGWNTEGEIVT